MQSSKALTKHKRLSTTQSARGEWKVTGCLILLVARHWESIAVRLDMVFMTDAHRQEAADALAMYSESGTLTVVGELAAAFHST